MPRSGPNYRFTGPDEPSGGDNHPKQRISNGFKTFPSTYGGLAKALAPGAREFSPMTPGPEAQFGGNVGLNPGAPRYQPPQRRAIEAPVRPESSMSNASFLTQMPPSSVPNPFGPIARPGDSNEPRRTTLVQPYRGGYGMLEGLGRKEPQRNGNIHPRGGGYGTLEGLGTDFASLQLGGTSSRALTTLKEDSDHSNENTRQTDEMSSAIVRHDSSLGSSNPSAKFLVEMIKRGETEDPYDRSLKRYDTPGKPSMLTLGPARFKDSKTFSATDNELEGGIDTAATQVKPTRLSPAPPQPDWLSLAIRGLMVPSLDEIFDAMPFIELCRCVVVRIRDVPYTTTRPEMVAFVSRNSQILRQPKGSPYHAIHIIMERETGKTGDTFIEFSDHREALAVYRRFQRRVAAKRPPKVGDRVVEVLMSSQDELMAQLFPRAKHVRWVGGMPVIDRNKPKYYADQPAAGFQSFMHLEEFVMLVKHAELSERSPFASKSPCRVYESMISILYKFPWYAVDYIKIKDRRAIYECTTNLIRLLIENLRRAGDEQPKPMEPNTALLAELAVAALTCPGFSEGQKSNIFVQLRNNGYKNLGEGRSIDVNLGGNHVLSHCWPFAAVDLIPDVDMNLVLYYAGLFRQATEYRGDSPSLYERQMAKAEQEKPMGNVKIDYGQNTGELSLAQVAKIEYEMIESLLKRACGSRANSMASGIALANNGRGAMI